MLARTAGTVKCAQLLFHPPARILLSSLVAVSPPRPLTPRWNTPTMEPIELSNIGALEPPTPSVFTSSVKEGSFSRVASLGDTADSEAFINETQLAPVDRGFSAWAMVSNRRLSLVS